MKYENCWTDGTRTVRVFYNTENGKPFPGDTLWALVKTTASKIKFNFF